MANKMKASAKQLRRCWQMKKLIHEMFGWPLVFYFGLLIIGAVNVLHMLYETLKLNYDIILVFFAYFEIYLVGIAGQTVASKVTVVKKSLFAKTRSSNVGLTLVIQINHQNMEVSPAQICRIDNKFVASVDIPNTLH